MRKLVFTAATLAMLLAACASGVKLDDVPVEDRKGSTVVPGPGDRSQSRVESVTADSGLASGQAPVGVPRIVYFDFDSYVIKPEFQAMIEQHARYLKQNGARHVVIEGHTDERGGREYNLALGQRRSEAVRRALGLLGVAEPQIEAVSFGKEKPASPGSDEAAWAQNRRAEISYR